MWVLTPDPPHKQDQDISSFPDRLAMLELSITGEPAFELSRLEIERPGPKRVMDILEAAGVRPSTVLVTQGKALLTRDQRVEDGETVEILSVVSGG